jgi:hypothetical protein
MATATSKQKEIKEINMKITIANNLYDLYCKKIKIKGIRDIIKPSQSLPLILRQRVKIK